MDGMDRNNKDTAAQVLSGSIPSIPSILRLRWQNSFSQNRMAVKPPST